jgi:UDP-N-acetylglucosamine 2-epimerase (non-hydrolysing)
MEAGNRCFDQRVPEETNRKIVDHISDINLTYSSIAREYLLREGLPPDRVIKTGSPMFEVIEYIKPKFNPDVVLPRYAIEKDQYYVVSSHREENINSNNFYHLVESLNLIAEQKNLPILVSTHPRTRNRIKETETYFHEKIQLLKPLGFIDYLTLQCNAKAVLSDSGTISEESSILGFPALNLREAHERPEAMEEASVMMTGLNSERILQGLSVLEEMPSSQPRGLHLVQDYSKDNVSEKVLRIIISYTDYIKRTVWKQ